ncbi:unnamed protein product [Mycena citricolor]|uniref:G domain-containing protein n=1 Tax=Mycena citricolor TaxID=2018698 RepID=A0AAD2Q2C5_9AGAR|nr:unnamed protein product [Mycena citricolor]
MSAPSVSFNWRDFAARLQELSLPEDAMPKEHITRESAQDQVTIAVMGPTSSGKTSFINLLSDSNFAVNSSPLSCTKKIQVSRPFPLAGKTVTLIDVPGFLDPALSDAEILRMIATYLHGGRLNGIVYTHRISDVRIDGIATRHFQLFQELCGASAFPNVMIATTMWHEAGRAGNCVARETQLLEDRRLGFRSVLERGGHIRRHDAGIVSAVAILKSLMNLPPFEMELQHELVDQHVEISETGIGLELTKVLTEQLVKRRKDLAALRQEMKEAFRENDHESRRDLEMESHSLQAEMTQLQADVDLLGSNFVLSRPLSTPKSEPSVGASVEQPNLRDGSTPIPEAITAAVPHPHPAQTNIPQKKERKKSDEKVRKYGHDHKRGLKKH